MTRGRLWHHVINMTSSGGHHVTIDVLAREQTFPGENSNFYRAWTILPMAMMSPLNAQISANIFTHKDTCLHCHGEGYKNGKECPKCNNGSDRYDS